MQTTSKFSYFPSPKAVSDHQGPRNFLCRHYSRCLDICIHQDWRGFTCGDCEAYGRMEMKPWEWALDAHNCAKLLFTASMEEAMSGGSLKRSILASDPMTGRGDLPEPGAA